MKTQPCMNCETGEMKLDTRDVTVQLGDLRRTVKAVHGWFCDACGEIEFAEGDSAERYAAAMDGLAAERSSEDLPPCTKATAASSARTVAVR